MPGLSRGKDDRGLDAVLGSRAAMDDLMTRLGWEGYRSITSQELLDAHIAANPHCVQSFTLSVRTAAAA